MRATIDAIGFVRSLAITCYVALFPAISPLDGGIEVDRADPGQWAFQPLSGASPPEQSSSWIRNDVDRFILASLEAEGLSPNEEASRRTLVRRIHFDLWGLPPEPAEVEAFVNDSSPDAYERLLLDAVMGDQTLFLRADEIEASWRYADEVLAGWQGLEAPSLLEYPAGSWGPEEADRLFQGCEGGWSRG